VKQVGPIRRQLGFPTIFNLLGPLANPARAEFQLLGVGKPRLRPLLAAALARLGVRRAVVVSGDDGLDEVTLAGSTSLTEVTAGTLADRHWTPEEFGLARAPLDDLKISGPEESAAMIRRVLAGVKGAARDIVVLNAAAGLWTVGRYDAPSEAAEAAASAIDSGAAAHLLERLAAASHR
jgi:anthranilate phosphoribosyltransferase